LGNALWARLQVEIYRPLWYAEEHIQVFKNQRVTRIDLENRCLLTKNGMSIACDELMLCTGADAIRCRIIAGMLQAIVVGGRRT
jgi:NADPH-dependent 2,4-dienoyl-CoA reductase/sulfur reductase-like enzyme